MSAIRHFFIPGEPQGKGRPRFMRNGHTYTPEKTRSYEKAIQYYYVAQCHHDPYPKDVALRIGIQAVFEPPKSTPKKRLLDMLAAVLKPTKKPDWDNIGKVICDSLNGIAWHDDSQITSATVKKRYGPEAGVDVWIMEDSDDAV